MKNIYLNGVYLERNRGWHSDDSLWKANHISQIIRRNNLKFFSIAEIGCGSGKILDILSEKFGNSINFYGYEISPHAFGLAHEKIKRNLSFYLEDLLASNNTKFFDILLIIDVLEHISDCLEFANKCRLKAKYKIYHIPLDMSVLSVLKRSYMNDRYKHGHLHYFSSDSALAVLKDTGHEIIDYYYTDPGTYYFGKSKTYKRALINIPRWVTSAFSIPFSARVFGRYSLLVLTS